MRHISALSPRSFVSMTTVSLTWPSGQIDNVPALWLRDNCPCEQCRIELTSEHRFIIATVDPTLTPVAVTQTDDGVVVDWGDHVSTYSQSWMDDVRAQVARCFPPMERWDADDEIRRFSFDILDTDPPTEISALDHFCRFGAIVITDTPCEPGWSETLYRRWGPPTELPFAKVHDVYVDPSGYNVAHTAEALPPHNDFASKRNRPSGQILHMLANEAEDGDSIIVDGLAIVDQLTDDERSVLTTMPAAFRQFSETTETWSRSTVLQIDESGAPVGLCYSNQLLQAIDPWHTDASAWYEAYHRLTTLIIDPANQVRFRLSAGDLLMLHGHRMLHGRTAFSPASGVRHLQDIYFDFDDVANELHRRQRLQTA